MTVLVGVLNAQVRSTGVIAGTVSDPSGAIVPGAQLKLTDLASGAAQSVAANKEGGFLFANLRPGSYRLAASSAGFQTSVYDSVIVDAARTTNLAVQLKVGELQQTFVLRSKTHWQ